MLSNPEVIVFQSWNIKVEFLPMETGQTVCAYNCTDWWQFEWGISTTFNATFKCRLKFCRARVKVSCTCKTTPIVNKRGAQDACLESNSVESNKLKSHVLKTIHSRSYRQCRWSCYSNVHNVPGIIKELNDLSYHETQNTHGCGCFTSCPQISPKLWISRHKQLKTLEPKTQVSLVPWYLI